MSITVEDVRTAADHLRGHVRRTACERSVTLSAMTGAEVYLKLENQQFTASFKERGALNRLLALDSGERDRGVIAMSAGNHAQAVAYHAERLGIGATIVMPRSTPNAKVEATRVFGADVRLHGAQFDETREYTRRLAVERDLTLIHPYDDPLVVAGQGTVALEVLDQVPDVAAVIVPVGGGGLIAGIAVAVKALRPDVAVIGVQTSRYPAAFNAFHGESRQPGPKGSTVAEGIAVKAPGEITLDIIRRLVDDIVLVGEEQIEQALFTLLEIEKTVTEGAGAAALAALMADPRRFAGRGVVALLSGGNVDMMVLSSLLQRGLVRSHRLVRVRVELPDVPGSLAHLTGLLAELDSNIIDIHHQRVFDGSSARAAVVEVELQLRGEEQSGVVLKALADAGYEASLSY